MNARRSLLVAVALAAAVILAPAVAFATGGGHPDTVVRHWRLPAGQDGSNFAASWPQAVWSDRRTPECKPYTVQVDTYKFKTSEQQRIVDRLNDDGWLRLINGVPEDSAVYITHRYEHVPAKDCTGGTPSSTPTTTPPSTTSTTSTPPPVTSTSTTTTTSTTSSPSPSSSSSSSTTSSTSSTPGTPSTSDSPTTSSTSSIAPSPTSSMPSPVIGTPAAAELAYTGGHLNSAAAVALFILAIGLILGWFAWQLGRGRGDHQ
jgi:hypothetical protein